MTDTRKLIEEQIAALRRQADSHAVMRGKWNVEWAAALFAGAAALEASLPTEDEEITNEALWDFAGDLLDAWNIEDANPPSMIEDFRDRFTARFRRSPVPPETDRNAVEAEIVWVLAGAGVESSKRRTIAGHVIRSLAEAGLLAAVPPVTEEPDLPNGHAPVEQLSGFLARRVVPPVPEETVREWADYFGHHSSHVGGRPVFTGDEIAAILRGPKPFGSSRPVPEGDKR